MVIKVNRAQAVYDTDEESVRYAAENKATNGFMDSRRPGDRYRNRFPPYYPHSSYTPPTRTRHPSHSPSSFTRAPAKPGTPAYPQRAQQFHEQPRPVNLFTLHGIFTLALLIDFLFFVNTLILLHVRFKRLLRGVSFVWIVVFQNIFEKQSNHDCAAHKTNKFLDWWRSLRSRKAPVHISAYAVHRKRWQRILYMRNRV